MKANPVTDRRYKSPDIQYKDFSMYNNTNTLQLARQDVTYTSPIIDDVSEYYLSINRFAISHMAIPIYFFDNTDQKYSVTIVNTITGNSNIGYLIYESAGNYASFGYTQPVFYYQQFVNMVNAAITTAKGAPANVNEGIYLDFNPIDGKFSLYFEPSSPPGGNPVTFDYEIYMSSALFQQLQFFGAVFSGSMTDPRAYKINLYAKPLKNNYYEDIVSAVPVSYFYVTQEREALYLLNDIQNIAFVTNRIPTTREYIPNLINSGELASKAILVNFIPDLGQGRNLSEYQYYPQGYPNLINMDAAGPLSSIDVQIFFVTNRDQFYPLYLEPSESINIKFAFYKKSMFNHSFTSLMSDKLNKPL